MRRWNIAMWLGEAALLCVVASCSAPAQAQSIGSQQVTGEVSASASSNVQAEVRVSVEGGGTGSANFSDGGGGSAALRGAIAPANSGVVVSHHLRGTASVLKDSAVKNVKENGRPAANRLVMMNRARAAHAPDAMEAALTRASPNPGAIHGAVPQSGSYSSDFQDSTKGTALISPFDLGTTGPFSFSPGMNVTLPDFSNRQFLSPTLRVSGGSGGKGTGRRGGRNGALASAGGQSDSSSSSIGDDLGLDVFKNDLGSGLTSDPEVDLGASIPTSATQQ
jgi:hypothetical protein